MKRKCVSETVNFNPFSPLYGKYVVLQYQGDVSTFTADDYETDHSPVQAKAHRHATWCTANTTLILHPLDSRLELPKNGMKWMTVR